MDDIKHILGRYEPIRAPEGFVARTMARIHSQQREQRRANTRRSAYLMLGATCVASGAIMLVLNLAAPQVLGDWLERLATQPLAAQQARITAPPPNEGKAQPDRLATLIDNAVQAIFPKETQPK